MVEETDTTKSLISTARARERIGFLFPDFAILDARFHFVSISQNILRVTGYQLEELLGQSVNILSGSSDLKMSLEEQLKSGFFEERVFEFNTRKGKSVSFSLSAFYLGLVTDINGLVILKFKNANEIEQIQQKLAAKNEELDSFIYNSAHSLRGPLATLKGLINLATLSRDPQEMEFLLKQMNEFAERLDEKLHRLVYFAESDKSLIDQPIQIALPTLLEKLKGVIRETSIDYPVRFECTIEDKNRVFDQGDLILSILNNLVLFLCRQPKLKSNKLVLDMHCGEHATEIMLRSRGFTFCESLLDKMNHDEFGYSEILNLPELFNYYAAQKVAAKLKGSVRFMSIDAREVVILVAIPLPNQLSLF